MRIRGATGRLLMSAVLVGSSFMAALPSQSASAEQILERSLTLQTGNTGDGGSKPGGEVNHQFTFTVPTGGNIGSILFEYCTIASVEPCVTPDGLDTTSATIGNEVGATGFSVVNTTNGAPYVTRPAALVGAGTDITIQLQDITNPTNTNETFFVRISTFTSIDTSGTAVDTGSVAASTASQIVLSGVMPESLIFCTGETIDLNTNGIPDCSTATAGNIAFDKLFSPTDTATATSQMAASTNATYGYVINVSGSTLISGSNEIPAMETAGPGIKGVSQFGMNLVANTTATSTTPVGAVINPASDINLDLRGRALGDYAVTDSFKFSESGQSIADSAAGGLGPTNSQIYTSSYIVNVSGSQPAGTYVTTLTYVCTPTF